MRDPYDRFWAGYLGVQLSDWSVPGVSVSAHVGLEGYRGVWFFQRRERLVVSAPESWIPRIRQYLAGAPQPTNLMEEAALRELFGADFERSIGPAFHGALIPERFRPFQFENVRPLTADDGPALSVFRAECGEEAVATAGMDEAAFYQAAYFHNGQVAAWCGYRPWSEAAGDPGVLTHPAYRARGWGTAVVSMTVERALAAGKLMLYQTLESNSAAVRLAQRLGYERYAQHVAVRLKASAPSR